MSITVVIADDHELIHHGVVSILTDTNAEIVGHAYNGQEAIELVQRLRPDLVLLDLSLIHI